MTTDTLTKTTFTVHTDDMTYSFSKPEDMGNIAPELLLTVYNHLTGRNPTKFASKIRGQETVFRAFEKAKEASGETDIDLRTKVLEEPEVVEEAAEEAPAKKSRPRVNTEAKITVLVDNPKRPGSGSYRRFALYKTGQTIGQFLKLGGTLADLRWDKKHNFIKVEESK